MNKSDTEFELAILLIASDIKDVIDKTSILLLFLILLELSIESVIISFLIFEFFIFFAASPLKTA